jgi:chaperonin GroES
MAIDVQGMMGQMGGTSAAPQGGSSTAGVPPAQLSPEQSMQPGMEQMAQEPVDPEKLLADAERQKQAEETKKVLDLQYAVNSTNLAEDLDDEELKEIAVDLIRRIKEDEQSMSPWLKRYDEYLKLALQVKEKKNFPWPNAANIKYPIVTIASMQFHARAYPAIMNNKSIVKGKVIGYDPAGTKAERAERIGKHMTYQLTEQVENWDEDMDKLCLILPIAGCVFKDVDWSGFEEKLAIDLVLPTEVIVNYWAKSMEDARRITRKRYFYKNTIIEYQRNGQFVEVDLGDPKIKGKTATEDSTQLRAFQGTDSKDVPYELYECHTYLDLDLDGYQEPYTVVLEPETQTILRISPNFSLTDVKKNEKGEVVRIRPRRRIIKYDFIPSPDGGLLGVGFGLLLGSLNEVVNTSINQILDQGTMKTTSGGFIAKGIRLKGGKMSFEPNEWKVVQMTGDDLRKGIVPLPVGDPSPVLFNLLQAIDQKSSQVIAISEISTGKLPGQNTPATTTISSIEEGMKLFNAIFKRIWRQLKKEFKLVFELNRTHLTDEEYFTVLDDDGTWSSDSVKAEDYNSQDLDVIPESDPTVVSEALRLLKAQQLVELIPLGAVDPAKAGQRILVALDQPNPQELMPQPQQDPAMMKAQMEMVIMQQEAQFKAMEAKMKLEMKQMEIQLKQVEMQLDMQLAQQEHGMKLEQSQQKHQMGMQQTIEKAAAQKAASKIAPKKDKQKGNNAGNNQE